MTRSCTTCKFYSAETCRRSPPVRLPRKFDPDARAGNRVRDETLIWGWPTVVPTDWCGEHVVGRPNEPQKPGDDRGQAELTAAVEFDAGVISGAKV